MKAQIMELLQPNNSEPRVKPLSIPVSEKQLQYYRDTCALVTKVKGKNTVPLVAGAALMDLCKDIRKKIQDESQPDGAL